MEVKTILEYLKNQKIAVVENIDLERKVIRYSNKIKGPRIEKIQGDEEIVRAYTLARLVNDLNYPLDRIELETEYTVGRAKKGGKKPRIDIIVRNGDGDAFLFIETKGPASYERDEDTVLEDQLFSLAPQEVAKGHKVHYLVRMTVDTTGTIPVDKCQIIDYKKYPVFDIWKKLREATDELPADYGKARKARLVRDSDKDLIKDFTQEQIEGLRIRLHNVLWGGGGTDDNDVFSSLVNLILAKIQDESERESGQEYVFQNLSYEDGSIAESNEQLFERINDLYRRALRHRFNITDTARLNKSYVIDENKFGLTKLRYTVSQLEKLSLVDGKNSFNGKDILGDFFEGIIRDGFKQSKGQFFTPVNIIKFILWGMQLDRLAVKRINEDRQLPYVIDPSTGSGSFLIEYMRFTTNIVKRTNRHELLKTRDVEDSFASWFLPDHRENRWAKDYIYGSDINFNLSTAAKVNMILHGDGSTNIFPKDGLLPFSEYKKESAPNALNKSSTDPLYGNKHVNGEFDVVISNPPFSVDLDTETRRKVAREFVYGAKKSSENLFIERYYQLLRERGRLGVVLPDSVYDTTANKYIRLFIYKYFHVRAVVSLPQLTFEPYTSTKTSILFAQKKTSEEVESWNRSWTQFQQEWSKLRTRCQNLISVYFEKNKAGMPVQRSSYPSIAESTEEQDHTTLSRMLDAYIEPDDKDLTARALAEKYLVELKELCKSDTDTIELHGHCNSWWVFSKVAPLHDVSVLLAEVDQVGYKRTKRGEKPASNELFRTNAHGEVVVDDGLMETALDALRGLEWE